jgi:hypothetical protein
VDRRGRSGWKAYAAGKSRNQVALALMTSAALPGFPANEYRLDLVNAFYERYLDRSGKTDPGLLGWTARLQGGVRYEEVVAEIVGDQHGNEFYAKVAP